MTLGGDVEYETLEPTFAWEMKAGCVEIRRTDVTCWRLTPWTQRLLDVAVAVNGTTPQDVMFGEHRVQFDVEEGQSAGIMFLPSDFWQLVDAGEGTETQIACAALSYGLGLHGSWDHPWERSDDMVETSAHGSEGSMHAGQRKLPTTPDDARREMNEWLGLQPDPATDPMWSLALELGLAAKWAEMASVLGTLGEVLGQSCGCKQRTKSSG